MTNELAKLRKHKPSFFETTKGSTRESIIIVLLNHRGCLVGKQFAATIRDVLIRVYGSQEQKPNQAQSNEINRCLRLIHEFLGIAVQTTEPRLKPYRRSSLGKTVTEQRQRVEFDAFADQWLAKRPNQLRHFEQMIWLCVMLARMGYGYACVIHIAGSLTNRQLKQPGFSVPIHPKETRGYCHEALWPSEHVKALRNLQKSPSSLGELAINRQLITHELGIDGDEDLADVVEVAWGRIYPGRLGFKAYAKRIRMRAQLVDGVPPALFEAGAQLPLPVEAQGGLGFFLKSVKQSAMSMATALEPQPNQEQTERAWREISIARSQDEATRIAEEMIHADWRITATEVLRRFSRRLAKLAESLQNPADRKRLDNLIRNTLNELDLPPHTVPAMGLVWIRQLLTRKKHPVKNATARQYLSQVVINGFLVHEHSYRMHEWDWCDHEDLMMRLGIADDETLIPCDRAKRINQFIRFWRGESADLFADWPNVSQPEKYTERYFRCQTVQPADFDEYFFNTFQAPYDNAKPLAVVNALCFYGGLRVIETLSLTLNDVRLVGGEVWLTVRKSKTLSGQRRIPLHVLAPPDVLMRCARYIRERVALMRHLGCKLSDVYVLGPHSKPDGFDRRSLIEPGLMVLRHAFGAAIDFHTLRHNFATWLLIRLAVYRGDLNASVLTVNGHDLFHGEVLALLEQLFNPRDRAKDYIVIRKLIGHASFAMTLNTYTHCFGLLLSTFRAQQALTDLIPNQQVIADPLP